MPAAVLPVPPPLYRRIAEDFAEQIAAGTLRPGERVPSLRRLSQSRRVSMTTALQAYLWLEDRGYLEARPQSGFYVRAPFSHLIPEPAFESREGRPRFAGETSEVLAEILETSNDPAHVPFGAGCASPELFPNRKLNLILRRVVREQPHHSAAYILPPGLEALRRQIARRCLETGCAVRPGDVVITDGACEAINLSLRAVARPGDVVAVESPVHFGIVETVTALHMKVIEISTHPQHGMDVDELGRAIRKHRVKAVVTVANCHNPLGFVMSDERKKALVETTARHDVAVVEDDLYGDLAFHGPRPSTMKSFDRKGLVLLCSSFSKVLSPGYRVGWLAAGRFGETVRRLKHFSTVAAPALPQLVLARFLETGGYDRHVKRLRTMVAGQVDAVRQAIAKYFPAGTRVTRPAGGYMLWVELPPSVDGLALYRAARKERISVLPGAIFSATGRFRHHLRINCGMRWSDRADRALLTLGRIAENLL